MGKILKVKCGNEKATEIFNKIYQGQIMLDNFKKAVKTGRENIKKLRAELKLLTDDGYYPDKKYDKVEGDVPK